MNENDVPPPTQVKIYACIVNSLAAIQVSLQEMIDILKTLKKDSTK